MKPTSRLSVLLIAILAALAGAQENYSTNWSGHRSYILNTSASGANVSGTVLNFPVLIRIGVDDSAIFAAAKAGGADLRFTKPNNTTRLPHEIESWNAVTRAANVWVRVDTVLGNNFNQTIRMHWGNAAAADSSRGSAVFDTANGFEAVFHMNGAVGDTLRDATANGYKGVPTVGSTAGSTAPRDTTGLIGSGKAFGGNNDDTDAGANTGGGYRLETSAGGRTNNSFNYAGNDAEFTLSTWTSFDAFRPTGNFSRRRGLITKASALTDGSPANADTSLGFAPSNNDPLTQWYLRPNNVDRVMHVQRSTIPSGGTAPFSVVASGGVAGVLNNWNYVSYAAAGAAVNGNRLRLYNTTGVTTREINDEPGLNKDVDVFIGALASGAGSKNNGMLFLNGMIDEVRISRVARDSHWVNLEYANQKAAQTLVGFIAISAAPSNLRYVPGNTAANDTLVFQVGASHNIVPTYAGGPVDSFVITSGTTLPAGVSFSKSTGAFQGTPTATFAAATRTVTAYSTLGNTTRDVVVSSVVGALANLSYTQNTASYPAGLPIAPNVPSYTGRAPTKFAVSAGTLPAGLLLDTSTGRITGTPTTAAAAANVTIRATNTTGPDTATRVLGLTITAAEDYSTWTQRDTLWLNTQTNGAGTTTLVRDFPVLVRLDSTAFASVYTQSSGRGADLRFLKGATNVRLPHQIERWDSAGRKAAIWVLLDSVRAGDRTQTVRMLWGKAGAPDASSGPSVFDTAKGFRAVFHLGEGNNDTAFNSTQYTFKGVPNRTNATNYNFPTDTAGAIGRAREFGTGPAASATANNAGNYFVVAGSAAPLAFPEGGPFTVSTWAIVRNAGTSKTLVSKSDRAYSIEFRNTGADWEFAEHNLTGGGWVVASAPAATSGIGGASTIDVWTHIMGVRNGSATRIIVNGVVIDSVGHVDANTNAHVNNVDLNIGRAPDNNTSTTARYYWRGAADEVRVAQVVRSNDWAKLEYQNQRPAGQSLVWWVQPPVVVGVGGSGSARVDAPGFSVKAAGRGLVFALRGAAGDRAVLTLRDMQGRMVWRGAFEGGTLAWDGRGTTGGEASTGLYAARVTLLDKQGKATSVMDKKVPYTR